MNIKVTVDVGGRGPMVVGAFRKGMWPFTLEIDGLKFTGRRYDCVPHDMSLDG